MFFFFLYLFLFLFRERAGRRNDRAIKPRSLVVIVIRPAFVNSSFRSEHQHGANFIQVGSRERRRGASF